MNIECPQCGSNEFTKLSLVYAQGFSDLNARSLGWGIMLGSGGANLGFGRLKTKGELQTRLSQRVSPPQKWSYWKIVFGGLIGLMILEFMLGYVDTFLRSGGNFDQQLAWFGYTWLAIVVIILCTTLRHNVWTVQHRLRLWERSFMCRRCGQIVESSPTGDDSKAMVREMQP